MILKYDISELRFDRQMNIKKMVVLFRLFS